MKEVSITIVRFPHIQLETRYGHKLRGFFGNLFREHSPLLHNHFQDGKLRYAYPLIQYKIIDNIPLLVGINEGSELLGDLFLKIHFLEFENKTYPVHSKNIEYKKFIPAPFEELRTYQFKTLWLGLNQKNYTKYIDTENVKEKSDLLNQIIRNNILSLYKGLDIWIEEKIMVKSRLFPRKTKFKGIEMLGFKGEFITNADLPDYLGLGKSVSRGFGTIIKI